MGLFTKLGSAWREWSTLPKAWDNLGDAWKAIKGAPKTFASGAVQLAGAVRDGQWGNAWKAYSHTFMTQANIVLKPLEALSNVPVAHQVFGTALWAQNEFVKRPIATANLASGDQLLGNRSLFDGDTWRKAYNTTQYVTVGQSGTYTSAAFQEAVGIQDERFAVGFDPRDRATRQKVYMEDTPFKYLSGGVDFLITAFADPTVVGLQAGLAAKTKYVSQPMNAAAVAARKPELFVSTSRADKLYKFTEEAPTAEALRQRVFASHRGGDKAAAMLWATRGDRKLWDLTMRSLYADMNAFDELVAQAPRLADVVGSTYASKTIGDVLAGQGDSAAATASAQALKETRTQAFVDAMVNGKGTFGQLNPATSGGLLANQNLPRLTLSSAWRVGIHNQVTFAPGVWRGHPIGRLASPAASRARYFLPTARFSRYLDLNDVNGTAAFRANLERAPLTQAQVEKWASAYGRATAPESRFRVAVAAEGEAWSSLAAKHGISPEAARKLLPQINKYRTQARQISNDSRQFMSTEAQKLADKYIEAGRAEDAYRVNQSADQLDAAIRRGEQPTSVMHVLDEDGNSLLLPDEWHVPGSRSPVLVSQTADYLPMADWVGLDKGMFWHRKAPGGARVVDASLALADTVNQFWKTAALLRPGYTPRMLTDDGLRRMFTVGAAPVLRSATVGAVNAFTNFVRRGRNARDRLTSRTLSRDSRTRDYDVEVAGDTTRVADDLVDDIPGIGVRYGSHERALAAGALDPDSYIVASESAFRAGADMPNDLRIILQGGRDGTIPKAPKTAVTPSRLTEADYTDPALLESPVARDVLKAFSEGRTRADVVKQYVASGVPRAQAKLLIDEAAYAAKVQGKVPAGAKIRQPRQLEGPNVYRNHMIDYALHTVGRDAYATPQWQRAFVDTLVDMQKGKKPGQVGVEVVVDPYTGTSPSRVGAGDFTHLAQSTAIPMREGAYVLDAVYDFVSANHSLLLAPNSLLHARITPGGNLKLSVGTIRGKVAEPIKPTGGRRYMFAGKEFDYASQGMKPLVLKDRATGETRTMEAAFEGAHGARFMEQSSSAGGGSLWHEVQGQRAFDRALSQDRGAGWEDVSPGQAHYAEAWEASVNKHIGNDPVARQFVAGRSEDTVLAWIEQTSEGRAWWGRMGPQQARYVDHVRSIRAMVEMYVPNLGDDASKALATKVLNREATIDDLKTVVPEEFNMPQVHGMANDMTFGGPVARMYNKAVNKAFNALGNLPADKLVRFPFAAERYEHHARQLYATLSAEMGKRGASVPASTLKNLSDRARQLALADMKKYMYDSTAVFDLANANRLMVPFANAIGDAFTKWGVIIREQAGVPGIHIMKTWTAPDRNGLVYDEDGNWKHMDPDSGVVTWYQLGPDGQMTALPGHKPAQEYIAFQLPSWVKPDSVQGNVLTYMNKETFNTMLNVPTAGPVVAVPMNYFTMKNPELAAERWVRKWVLPYGPSADYTEKVIPSNAVNVYQNAKRFFTDNEEENRNLAAATWMTMATDHALGKRADMPTIAEANEAAGSLMNLRFWAQWGVGYTANFRTVYQHQVDVYRQMLAESGNVNEATAHFLEEMGPEYAALTMSVTRNNAGLPASVGSYRAMEKYAKLIAQFPDLAPLIVGAEGAGAFNQAVYQAQLSAPMPDGSGRKMREVMTLQESVEDNERRQVWIQWGRLDDAITAEMARRGINSLTQRGAEDLRAARNRFVEKHKTWTSPQGVTELSPWYVEHSTTDRSKLEGRLVGMAQLLAVPGLSDRDDMRGLAQYLDMRSDVRRVMSARGYKTLDSAKAQSLRNAWQRGVFNLKESNLSFSSLHARWLYRDDLSFDIPGV